MMHKQIKPGIYSCCISVCRVMFAHEVFISLFSVCLAFSHRGSYDIFWGSRGSGVKRSPINPEVGGSILSSPQTIRKTTFVRH